MKVVDAMKHIDNIFLSDSLKGGVISGIEIDPSKLEKGNLFVCLKKGQNGFSLIKDAMPKRPIAIVCGEDYGLENQIVVEDVRKAYSLISKALSNDACDKIKMIAVTGTNGKTTTAKIIADILKFSGKRVGVIGTLGAQFDGKTIDTGFTTPDPHVLHRILGQMQKNGVEFVVMEASAHALELKKLEGIKFDVSIFTNLTQDHLDFFGDMDKYFEAKKKLFSPEMTKTAIFCGDDEKCFDLTKSLKIPYLTFGFNERNDVVIQNFNQSGIGMSFQIKPFEKEIEIKSRLVGDYNAQNLTAAIIASKMCKVDEKEIEKSLENIGPAEGRFNLLQKNGRNIVIDFAHTPDGLENVLKAARKISNGELVCVFGCGGNRDRLKRPIMGKIASKYADKVIITSDNPRFEDEMEIIREIERGVSGDYKILPIRQNAIEHALNSSGLGDTIVIAGKGAEKYQEIKGVKIPYSDFDVVENLIGQGDLKNKEKGL